MDSLKVAQNILIKRSSGQTHSAMISQLNPDNGTCTVEWFEKGETKGKEVDLDQIQSLNPTLFKGASPEPERKAANTRNGRKSEVQPKKNGAAGKAARGVLNGTMATSQRDEENTAPAISDRANNNNPNKRKSQTVAEIERLKNNRDDRRQKQEEARMSKVHAQTRDPGNPNWEFQEMVFDFKDTLDFTPLRPSDDVLDHRICVAVRKRPMSKKELGRKEVDVVTVPAKDVVIVHQPQQKVDLTKFLENQKFRFDYAFDENSDNDLVYRFTAQPLVRTIFEEGMATCFAYGQTGSGKTHTMGGDFTGKAQDVSKGIYALTARDVFRLLNGKDYKALNLAVSCSFFEIYSSKVFDLLAKKAKLRIMEDGKKEVQIVGLAEMPVHSEQDVLDLINRGTGERTSGQTHANNNSSRSHAVFQIVLRKRHPRGGMGKLHGKFSLIDLAGNERGADTMNWGGERQARMEAAEINTSLLSLKECIRAMGKKSSHIPFRGSKLTLVLRDSFVGDNSRTCMITMVSPGMNSCEHSLNSLRYSDRVKELGADSDARPAPRLADLDYGDIDGEEDDLALVHSRNESDFPDDVYRHGATLNRLEEAEERLLDDAPAALQSIRKELEALEKAQAGTAKVGYDMESYAAAMKSHLAQAQASVARLQGAVEGLNVEMEKEAELAAKANTNKANKRKK